MMGKDDQKKDRIPAIRVDFGKNQILSGMSAPGDGRLMFFDENGQPVSPVFVEVDSTYARKKGSKVLNRVGMDPTDIRLDQNASLARYRYVFAVDTNTTVVNSVRTSITVSAYVADIELGKPRWNARLVRQDAFEFQEAAESPEKIGWCELIALIEKSKLKGPIAVIVDAHLGELKPINDRTQAICRGYFLPPSIELIYASADAGGVEFIANAALAHCDKIGAVLLRLSQQVPVMSFQKASSGSPYSCFRMWTAPQDSTENWRVLVKG